MTAGTTISVEEWADMINPLLAKSFKATLISIEDELREFMAKEEEHF